MNQGFQDLLRRREEAIRLLTMKPNRVTAGLLREEDKDRILELNRLEYGPDDILATDADFAWRHDQNPAGQAIVVTVRDDPDEVVGFIWVVPLRLRLTGQDYSAATGTNLVIRSDHRNSFAYTKLIRRFQRAITDNGISLHFSFVSEETFQRQRKQTPQAVFTIPLFVKPFNFESLAQTYFDSKWKNPIIGRAGSVVSPFLFRQRSKSSDTKITIEAVDRCTPDFDRFWLKVRDKYPVMVIRDRAFLAWRFAEVSGRRYHILVARARDEMVGYAVLRCSNIGGVKTGLIMDFLVIGGVLGETAGAFLLAEAEAYFRAQEMSLGAGLMMPLAVEQRILRRAGYARLPLPLAPRAFRFAFFVHRPGETDLSSLSARQWFVTLADYESF
jgi:hypothetical protein